MKLTGWPLYGHDMIKDQFRTRTARKPLTLAVVFAVVSIVAYWVTKASYEDDQVWLTFLGACLFLTTITISVSAWVVALWRRFIVGRQPADPQA